MSLSTRSPASGNYLIILVFFRLHCVHRSHRGGTLHLTSTTKFTEAQKQAIARIDSVISSKLNDFFELSEYEWIAKSREDTPSMYLYELVNWLTTVVDGLVVKDEYKQEAYKGAVNHVAACLMVREHYAREYSSF